MNTTNNEKVLYALNEMHVNHDTNVDSSTNTNSYLTTYNDILNNYSATEGLQFTDIDDSDDIKRDNNLKTDAQTHITSSQAHDETNAQTRITSSQIKQIIMLLDSSGSMSYHKAGTVSSINKFLEEQKNLASADILFTMILFATEVTTKYNKLPLNSVNLLDNNDYIPDGNTALYDAIDIAIDRYKDLDQTLMVIVTDGAENSSKYATHDSVTKKIEEMKQKGWNFIFLANGLEVSDAGNKLGFTSAHSTDTFSQTNNIAVGDEDFAPAVYRSLSIATECLRSSSQMPNLSQHIPCMSRTESYPLTNHNNSQNIYDSQKNIYDNLVNPIIHRSQSVTNESFANPVLPCASSIVYDNIYDFANSRKAQNHRKFHVQELTVCRDVEYDNTDISENKNATSQCQNNQDKNSQYQNNKSGENRKSTPHPKDEAILQFRTLKRYCATTDLFNKPDNAEQSD